jgi:alkylated DNA repair dioxygenase AlkB
MEINGLTVIDNYIDTKTHDDLIVNINNSYWNKSLSRYTQHYGYTYNYNSYGIEQSAPIPEWIISLFPNKNYDQCIINRYLPGQGINPHIDSPVFADEICTLSIGSKCIMYFTKGVDVKQVILKPCSLLTIKGTARNDWKHGIPARKSDFIDRFRKKRETRYSITMRTIKK